MPLGLARGSECTTYTVALLGRMLQDEYPPFSQNYSIRHLPSSTLTSTLYLIRLPTLPIN